MVQENEALNNSSDDEKKLKYISQQKENKMQQVICVDPQLRISSDLNLASISKVATLAKEWVQEIRVFLKLALE